MKCPFCGNSDSKVIDSRPDKGGTAIRRRRECEECSKRFTTHERVEEMLPQVCKKDGRREPFDRMKIISGIKKACENVLFRSRTSSRWLTAWKRACRNLPTKR